MSWNYRVVHHLYTVTVGPSAGKQDDFYAVHEVYYDKNDKPKRLTKHEVSPAGESRVAFAWTMEKYVECFAKPVLIFIEKDQMFSDETEPPIVDP